MQDTYRPNTTFVFKDRCCIKVAFTKTRELRIRINSPEQKNPIPHTTRQHHPELKSYNQQKNQPNHKKAAFFTTHPEKPNQIFRIQKKA